MTATTAAPTLLDTLNQWQAEVRTVNVKNGWFEKDRTLEDGIALLNSEVYEAFEAFRRWGLEDATEVPDPHQFGHSPPPKPEGVGSELADVLIRLLDEVQRQNVPMALFGVVAGDLPKSDTFTGWVNALSKAINKAEDTPTAHQFAIIYGTLTAMAARFFIDLPVEYQRKVAHNATRGYRHGGKHL